MARAYSLSTSWLHWLSAPAIVGAIGTVVYAQTLTGEANKAQRGSVMFLHKSLGTTAALLLVPRLAAAVLTRRPPPLAGSSELERAVAVPVHTALYSFSAVMAASGVYMGLAGGNGLPLFFGTIPAWAQRDADGAKAAYDLHKLVGSWGKWLVAAHTAAALGHYARGHAIFQRINPLLRGGGGGGGSVGA